MKYFKVDTYGIPSLKKIQEIEITKETPKQVFYNGSRYAKMSDGQYFVKTYAEAVDIVQKAIDVQIDMQNSIILHAQKTLERLKYSKDFGSIIV